MGVIGNTSKNIEEPNVLRLYNDDSAGVVHQFRSSSVRCRHCINTNGKEFFGGYISILIHFGISIHFAPIWSDRGQMLDVKTTLRRYSLRGCANSNKCSWRTAKAPVTQLRRDCLTACFGERLSQAGSLPVRLKASHHPGTIVCKSQYLRCFRQVQKFQWNSIHFPRFFFKWFFQPENQFEQKESFISFHLLLKLWYVNEQMTWHEADREVAGRVSSGRGWMCLMRSIQEIPVHIL